MQAEVAELADAQDSKSCDPCGHEGSTPSFGTTFKPVSDKGFLRYKLFRNYPEISLKHPGCVSNSGREKLIVSNSNQFQPNRGLCKRQGGQYTALGSPMGVPRDPMNPENGLSARDIHRFQAK
jgi:hypothetical protein